MAVKLGLNGKLYRNTATHGSPSWSVLGKVRDLSLTMDKATADVTSRDNNGWRAKLPTLKEAVLEFDMVWDTADAGFSALQGSYLNDTLIEFAVMDGDITTPLTEGLVATFGVTKFDKKENLEEAQMVSVTLEIAPATDAPEWLVVAAS